MKRKLWIAAALCCLMIIIFPACEARETGSLKSFTNPYIAEYECTYATLGQENLLDKFDYIHILLVNKEELQIILKPKDGEKQILNSQYTFDSKTHELTTDIGILGYRFKQATYIDHGKFSIIKEFGNKQLVMNFEIK